MSKKWYEIGVDPNPPAGSYVVDVENIMFCCAQFIEFDGEQWHIPSDFTGRRIWWYA